VLNGAIYGLASHGRFNGAFKPNNRSRDVRGLYLAGGAAHPGPGMPMVLMSGWIAADALHADRGGATPVRAASELQALRQVKRSGTAVTWFSWYARRYVARHFHGMRVSREGLPADCEGPLIVYLNHGSWWDPLIALLLTQRYLAAREFAAPIDAAALKRYGILERIGFFGVEQGTWRGARQFLRTSEEVLKRERGAVCVTPQGRFADVRERPLRFAPGLGQLASRLTAGTILPLAVEYAFWEERTPEVLARFGSR
jgi:1-acyl-sn-glycerol-3-phosphate acyltransferase